MNYEFKTKPFSHQLEVFEATRDRTEFAYFWEQGTGKTKAAIDVAAYLYIAGRIDGALILAPNGVHRNWTAEEIGIHCPIEPAAVFAYHSSKAKTRSHQTAAQRLLDATGFAILAMSYDGISRTEMGKKLAKQFLTSRRCLLICDESARVKTPTAKVTRTVLAASKHAPYKRILSGTPIANSPFDIYSQVKILDKDFWKTQGLGNFTLFKNYFGIWGQGMNGATGKSYPLLVGHRNLDELYQLIQPISSRVLKEDVLDLPPKLYSKRFFELSPKQRRLYDALKSDFYVQLENEGDVTADLAMVRLLRLQQITCGYLPVEDLDGNTKTVRIEEKNARLRLLEDILEDIEHKAIIWARFRQDIDQIMDLLGPEMAVRYDGQTGTDDRARAIERFQRGSARYFVANAQAAGEGLTLTAAKTVIYYSNSFKLAERLQSEDRAHRIGQDRSVHYIDLVALDTVDDHIIRSLREKLNIASQVTGDRLKEWL